MLCSKVRSVTVGTVYHFANLAAPGWDGPYYAEAEQRMAADAEHADAVMMAEIAAAMPAAAPVAPETCATCCAEPAQGTKTGTTRPADAKTDTASPSVDAAEPASVVAPKVKKTDGRLRARPAAAQPPDVPGRPTITVKDGTLSESADEAEKMLIAAGVPFYERSLELVRPITKIVDTFHGKKTTTVQLARVNTTYMRDVLGRIMVWLSYDARRRALERIDPPTECAATVLARAGEWHFPSISGVITTPTLRPDGTILDQAGFDEQTRLLLVDPPAMPAIPDNPTREDAIAALKLLKDLLEEFPLVADVDKSVALSTLITPIARGGFPVAPLHATDAPDAGSGKSLLHDLAALIVTGQRMPVVAAGRDAEESEKRLGAALLAGQPLVCIDNISGALSGDALCQYIERHRPQVRVLGKSELVSVETAGVTWYANGNNLVIVGDLCRRVVRARLDAKMEQPELREFKGDPVRSIMADRGAYIAAGLTICRAYAAAGRPKPAKRLASFEGWSDTVRSALVWLDQVDPVLSMASSRAEDPERGAFRDLLSTWADQFGTGEDHGKTARDVVTLACETTTSGGSWHPTPVRPNLQAALQAAVVGQSRQRNLSAASLGYWLRARKDAINGTYCFRNKNLSGETFWWVDALTAEAKRLSAAERLSSAANEQPQASGTATPGTATPGNGEQPPDDVAF